MVSTVAHVRAEVEAQAGPGHAVRFGVTGAPALDGDAREPGDRRLDDRPELERRVDDPIGEERDETLLRVTEGEAVLGRMESEQGADARREARMRRAGDLADSQ